MKKIRLFAAVAIVAAVLTTTTDVFAQRGQGRRFANNANGQGRFYANGNGVMANNADRPYNNGECILGLTTEQNEKITQLRTSHLQEVTTLRNQLNEKRARLRTLQTVSNPNLNEINKVIDEMATIRANIQKSSAAHRASVASHLTDDQKVVFNSRRSNRMGRGNGTMCGGGRGGGGRGQGMGW